jgi:hypothetical protein
MGQFSLYRAATISKAVYGDNEEPGYSTVHADFEAIEEAGVEYGKTLAEIQTVTDSDGKAWWKGRGTGFTVGTIRDPADPYFGSKAWIVVPGADLLVGRVLTHGVDGSQDWARPAVDSIPAACLVEITVTASSVFPAIDAHEDHLVLGVFSPAIDGSPLPAPLLAYEMDTPFLPARWTIVRTHLIGLGLSASGIDTWRGDNPNATPRDLGKKFKEFITV